MFEIVGAIRSGDIRQIIAQLLGIIAFLMAALSFQRRTQRGIVIMQSIASFCFTVHYAILGVACGFLMNTLAFFRAIVYSFRKTHKWAASVIWLVLFEILTVLIGVYAYLDGEGPVVILATVGTVIATIGYRLENAKLVRRVLLIQAPLWLSYDAIQGSIGGVLSEGMSICSIIIGILRLDIKKESANKNAEDTPTDTFNGAVRE